MSITASGLPVPRFMRDSASSLRRLARTTKNLCRRKRSRWSFINPVITAIGDEMVEDWEGCLSIPDIRGRVPRARAIQVGAMDRHGRQIDITSQDFPARVLQHETDHLDGVLFLDRMRSFESLAFSTNTDGTGRRTGIKSPLEDWWTGRLSDSQKSFNLAIFQSTNLTMLISPCAFQRRVQP